MKKFTLLATFLLLAGCASSGSTPPTIEDIDSPVMEETSEDSTSLMVPVDADSEVMEMVVEESPAVEEVKLPEVTRQPVPAPIVIPDPVVQAPAVKTINMTAQQWSFTPSTITVKKGQKVKLVVESVDVDHGLFIMDINTELKAGTTSVIEFTANEVGTFSFLCSVQCGSGHGGMRGTLVVEE
jgi:heme/copper-type cytochrome/quinol oxidase subunit 2